MDFVILGLTVSSVSAMGAILAAVSFWLNRGKVEERADQALARAKEGNDRYDKIMSAFADYRAAIAADIAIVRRWLRPTPLRWPQRNIGWQPPSNR